jgi:hypothetical protein
MTWLKNAIGEASRYVFRYRAPSGVLQLTLGISLVIAMLSASVILVVYYSKLSFLQQALGSTLRSHADSGIQYVMAAGEALPYQETRTLDLFGDGVDSAQVSRRPWGVFELATAYAWRGRNHQFKAALIAPMPGDIGSAALYVPNNHAPLYLVGKAAIHGTVYASDRKFTSGYIDGRDFEGERFVYGEVKTSQSTLPPLDSTLLLALRPVFYGQQGGYRLAAQERFPRGAFDFQQPGTAFYSSNQSIDMEDTLAGQVIIHSAMRIRITARAVLSDVIVMAPEIDIEKGFRGAVQCFATRSISVGEECVLQYPSALVLMGQEQDSLIAIGSKARVNGVVVIRGIDQTVSSRATFALGRDAVFQGMAYVNAAADIQGTLRGHIMAHTFQAKLKSAVYGGHMLDGVIDADHKPPGLPATDLWGGKKEKTIAKWLVH